jgi:hypothetical protein
VTGKELPGLKDSIVPLFKIGIEVHTIHPLLIKMGPSFKGPEGGSISKISNICEEENCPIFGP